MIRLVSQVEVRRVDDGGWGGEERMFQIGVCAKREGT